MRISDANPIQFWPEGQETFNEKEVCGYTQECFCQEFDCDREIRIQIESDDTSVPLKLNIYDENEVLLDSLVFDTYNGYYELIFTPSQDLSPQVIECGRKYKFTISTGTVYYLTQSGIDMTITEGNLTVERLYNMAAQDPADLTITMGAASFTLIHCDPGFVWNGSECVPECPPGYTWNGAACVDGDGCLEGCYWSGFECVCP